MNENDGDGNLSSRVDGIVLVSDNDNCSTDLSTQCDRRIIPVVPADSKTHSRIIVTCTVQKHQEETIKSACNIFRSYLYS
jgi:hypothetical protein